MKEARLPTAILTDSAVQRVLALLNTRGEEAMLVGGVVRNALLGLPQSDIDIATTARPEEVTRRAAEAGLRAIPTGIDHGTVTLVVEGRTFEVTTLREDIETDGRRALVRFGRDFSRDARRRDFTMNALYARADGEIIDFVGGLTDAYSRKVRFIGDPVARIREDYLRIMRFFRFAAQYQEGDFDPAGLAACGRERAGLASLSRERVRAEMMKLVMAPRAAAALEAMADCGILAEIFGVGIDCETFTCLVSIAPDVGPIPRLVALISGRENPILVLQERLKLSNTEVAEVEGIARAGAVLAQSLMKLTRKDIRRFAYRFGIAATRGALLVAVARQGMRRMPVRLGQRLKEAASAPQVSPFGGTTLLARGIVPGPRVGQIIARAEALWIAQDFPTNPAMLDGILARAIAEIGKG
jgi:poly(A) polymerase